MAPHPAIDPDSSLWAWLAYDLRFYREKYAGLDGSFSIISGEIGDVAYSDSPGGGRLVPSTPEVESYGYRYDRIGQVALPAGLSRQMIEKAREAL
jgi:hypothetical protein